MKDSQRDDTAEIDELAKAAMDGFFSDASPAARPMWDGLGDHWKGNWRRAVRAVLKAQKDQPHER